MRKNKIESACPSEKSLFMFRYDVSGIPSGKELAEYCEFLNAGTDVLNEFGIHLGTNGYSYLIEAIKIIIDRKRYDVRLNSEVYPLIAVKYGLQRNDPVEHSIRNAIDTAYEDHIKDRANSRMAIFPRKPTSKQFIIFAADEVYKRLCMKKMESLS